jgi:cation diffusion facilitator family transporter
MAGSTAHIIQSLIANSLIAVAKGIAAVFTGSGAMIAETIHSAADCGNQLLLLLGVNRARKPASPTHPLGYGRALYFWSFMVAMMLFLGGGLFSIYEGVHKIREPEDPDQVWLGQLILGFALAIEGWATYGNIKELHRRRGKTRFFRFLRETKDSDLVVVFGENSAAVLGLALAMLALTIAWLTGDGRWDGIGSAAIGVVLLAVAVFLAVEVKSLLMGERADPAIDEAIRELIAADPDVVEILSLITIQQGPGEVVVAMKLRVRADLPSADLCQRINTFEAALRTKRPEVKWCYVEPDLEV